MYEKLVEALRLCAKYGKAEDALANAEQAADAIEAVSRHAAEWEFIAESWQKACKGLESRMPRWIPIMERLPEEEESVFVVRKFLGIKGQVPPSTYTEIAYRIDDRWMADSDEYKIARHKHTDPLYWMPLPEPPKETK